MPDQSGVVARVKRRCRRLLGRQALDFYDIGEGLTMGRHSYGRPLVRWYYGDDARVRIGHFVAIADDVVMNIGGGHPTAWVSTFPFRTRFRQPGAYRDGLPAAERDIVVGSDVWIGRGARILAGVQIGDGAVIAAYAVVSSDVRPYAIAAGNPAREVRRRFSDEQIERLLRIRWWEWPDEEILRAVPLLSSPSIEDFLERYDRSPAPAPGA